MKVVGKNPNPDWFLGWSGYENDGLFFYVFYYAVGGYTVRMTEDEVHALKRGDEYALESYKDAVELYESHNAI